MARLGTSLRGKRKQNKKIDDKMRKIISVYWNSIKHIHKQIMYDKTYNKDSCKLAGDSC
jgi:hypothetical protein